MANAIYGYLVCEEIQQVLFENKKFNLSNIHYYVRDHKNDLVTTIKNKQN